MRELKFRAWDGERLHLWDSETHPGARTLGCTYPKLHYLPMSYLVGDSNDWVWEQYTGLTDRDGTDIYEGDIVRFKLDEPLSKEETVTHEIGTVEWCDNCCNGFRVQWHNYGNNCRLSTLDEIEVIGDVHQNPDLLTSLAERE